MYLLVLAFLSACTAIDAASTGCQVLNSKRGGDHGLRVNFTPVGADSVEITVYGKKDWVSFGIPKPGSVHMNLGHFVIGDGINGIVYDTFMDGDFDGIPTDGGKCGFIRGTEQVSYEDGFTKLTFTRKLSPGCGYHAIPPSGPFTYLWAAGDVDDSKDGFMAVSYHTNVFRGHPSYNLASPSTCEVDYTFCETVRLRSGEDVQVKYSINEVRPGFEDMQTVSVKVTSPAAADQWLGLGFNQNRYMAGGEYIIADGNAIYDTRYASKYGAGKPNAPGDDGFLYADFTVSDGKAYLEVVRRLSPGAPYQSLDPNQMSLLIASGTKVGIPGYAGVGYHSSSRGSLDITPGSGTLCVKEEVTADEISEEQGHQDHNHDHDHDHQKPAIEAKTAEEPSETEEEEPTETSEPTSEEEKQMTKEADAIANAMSSVAPLFLIRSRAQKNRCLTYSTGGSLLWKPCVADNSDQNFLIHKKLDGSHEITNGIHSYGGVGFQFVYAPKGGFFRLKNGPLCMLADKYKGLVSGGCKTKAAHLIIDPVFH